MAGEPATGSSCERGAGGGGAPGSLGAFLNHDGCKYSTRPSLPPSRPNPLSRYPPKPHEASNRFVQFTHTTPAFNCAAPCNATFIFSLQPHPSRPYTVLFPNSTASRPLSNLPPPPPPPP